MQRFALHARRNELAVSTLGALASGTLVTAFSALAMGLPDPWWLVAVAPWSVAYVVLVVVYQVALRRGRRFGIDEDRVSDHRDGRWRTVHFDEVVRVSVRDHALVLASKEGEVALPVWRFIDPSALLAFLRARVPWRSWSLAAWDQRFLAAPPPGRTPASGAEAPAWNAPTGYREPATRRPFRLRDAYAKASRPRVRPEPGLVATWIPTLAVTVHGAIGLFGRWWPVAAFFVLLGARSCFGVVKRLVTHARASKESRRRTLEHAEAWLGEEAVATSVGWTSVDGTRRLRFHAVDLLDPLEGPHVHYEELDASSGATLRSYAVWTRAEAPTPVAPRERAMALLDTTLEPGRMREGVPPELGLSAGEPRPLPPPTVLVLETYADGVLLRRLVGGGAAVGDTWHDDRGAALAQIEAELGVREPSWSRLSVELGAPWWAEMERKKRPAPEPEAAPDLSSS